MKRLAAEPFALIGVNSDVDKAALAPALEKEQITWRTFWNGPEGTQEPISTSWNVKGWPTIYVLDHEGVAGHVVDIRVDGGVNGAPQVVVGLARRAVDQVEVDVVEPSATRFARRIERPAG